MRVPPGSTLVTHGATDTSEWWLYARQKTDGSACYDIRVKEQSGGVGGAGNCARPPLQASGWNDPRLVFGLVASNAVTVVVEHSGAPAERFPAVAPDGWRVRFFAGEAGTTPITRIVAYDSSGKTIAEDRDVANMNT
jgi:hypothetical protein